MWGYRTIMVSDGNADQTDALHNHTLGKFLVTFGDVQSTDDLLATLGGVENEQKESPSNEWSMLLSLSQFPRLGPTLPLQPAFAKSLEPLTK